MARFTTRVVLHKGGENQDPLDWDEYETLHEAMEEQGFSRIITGQDGNEYHLPPAEYNKTGNFNREQVRDYAEIAAKKTRKDYSILVTEGSRCWLGLKKVKK